MNTDQVVYTTTSTSAIQPQVAQGNVTSHSHTIHSREVKFLEKERLKESKRALKQEKLADKKSTRAGMQY